MSLRNARSKQACFQGENRQPGITVVCRTLTPFSPILNERVGSAGLPYCSIMNRDCSGWESIDSALDRGAVFYRRLGRVDNSWVNLRRLGNQLGGILEPFVLVIILS